MSQPTLVVFLGDLGDSPVERVVGEARLAATLDTVTRALGSGGYAAAVLATDAALTEVGLPGLEVDVDGGEFHFGRRLARLVRARKLASVVYMGGGSVPLLSADELGAISRGVSTASGITNNRYSSDLVGFSAEEKLIGAIEGVERDNALAQTLTDAGLELEELPRTGETLFDIDAPTDLAVLKVSRRGGLGLREYIASLELEVGAYERVLPLFLDRQKQIIVAGRVGSHVWRYLETETACRVRLFAEERGMEADGRAEARTARSLLGYHLKAVGLERFFETLGELCDAAFVDSRVLCAHAGTQPSREDRFLSDLGRWEEVSDPFLRGLTRGASEARIPVLLGGHSLMSGALMLLNEHAWRLRDEGQL